MAGVEDLSAEISYTGAKMYYMHAEVSDQHSDTVGTLREISYIYAEVVDNVRRSLT